MYRQEHWISTYQTKLELCPTKLQIGIIIAITIITIINIIINIIVIRSSLFQVRKIREVCAKDVFRVFQIGKQNKIWDLQMNPQIRP